MCFQMELNGKHTKTAKVETSMNSEESDINHNSDNVDTGRPRSANEITNDRKCAFKFHFNFLSDFSFHTDTRQRCVCMKMLPSECSSNHR